MINWVMDYFIFECVGLILNKRIKRWRILLAGALAALLYCILFYVPLLSYVPYALYAWFIPLPIILWLYRPCSHKALFKEYLICIMVAAIFGGIIFNLWYVMIDDSTNISSMNILLLLGIGTCVTLIFYASFYYIRRQLIFPVFQYTIQVYYHNQKLQTEALLDTGNLLYVPHTHEPVLVIEYQVFRPLLSEEQRALYERFGKSSVREVERDIMEGIYSIEALIPFQSVGCRSGFLWRIRVEKVKIYKQGHSIEIAPCMIALSHENLFTDGQFHALLHPEFILEEESL